MGVERSCFKRPGFNYKTMTQAFLHFAILLVPMSVLAWPSGSPSCLSRPAHGRSGSAVVLGVENIGSFNWKVTLAGSHKGLVLNSKTEGSWDRPSRGYKNKISCITHSNRNTKDDGTFIFRSKKEGKPDLNGYVVFDYRNFAPLSFNFIVKTDPTEELEEELSIDFSAPETP